MRSGGPAANADPGGSNSARGVRKRGLGPSEFIGSASSSISKMSNVDMAELIPENLAHASIFEKTINEENVSLRFRYGNGRKGMLKIRRYIPATLFGYILGLYAGEGTKRPSYMKTRFEFVNSDPRKIIAVVNFLEMLGISRKEIRPRLQIRLRFNESTSKVKELECKWSALLKIPLSQFRKPSIRWGVTGSRSELGTLSIRVYNVLLVDLFAFWENSVLSPLLISPPP